MSIFGTPTCCLLALITLCGFVAQPAVAVEPTSSTSIPKLITAPTIRDVALQDGGVLVGTLLDAQSTAVGYNKVWILQQGKLTASSETNAQGEFCVGGLLGGVYEIHAIGVVSVVRLWSPGTAPPSAQQGIALVVDPEVVRAQGPPPGHGPMWFETMPLCCDQYVQGMILGGVITGLTYWAIDYNKPGS